MKSIVVAYDSERTIGRNGKLPWEGQLPDDMRHFAALTKGYPIIMGRRTYDSLPYKPLPNRRNIVLSLSSAAIEGAEVVRSLENAYEIAGDDAFVIGGASVYEQALASVDRVYATEILGRSVPRGDAFFPELPKDEWRIDEVRDFDADERNRYAYSFVTYIRRNLITLDSKE